MAGPGGGPPRKSHTKSRNGCKTCKRRHIRCDEAFPQCRNCTKHNCRCDYQDVATAPGSSPPPKRRGPDLMMSPEIEAEIENWHQTGVPPYPELLSCPRSGWSGLSRTDLRLVHHIIGVSIDLHRRGLSSCTVWAQRMPNFLAIALSNQFVMSAILGLSAFHMAWITRDQDTKQLGYNHRVTAMRGLQTALESFSKENCNAILAASVLLSWQATDQSIWASLQQSISTVLESMHPFWKQESELAQFVENERSLSASISMAGGYHTHDDDLAHLDQTIQALHLARKRVLHNAEHAQRMDELIEFVQKFREDHTSQTPEESFEHIQILRRWLFWLPPAMLSSGESDPHAIATLTQFFAVAVALDRFFPDLGGAYLGALSIGPIEEMYCILAANNATDPFNAEIRLALSLVDLPWRLVACYRNRLPWSPSSTSEHYSPGPPSPYNNLPEYSLPTSSSPASTSPSYAAYTPPLHSPPAVAVAGSPFQFVDGYTTTTAGATSHSIYPPSPQHISDTHDAHLGMSDLSHPASIPHSSAFTPPYAGDVLCADMSRAEGALGLNIGVYPQTHAFEVQDLVAPEPCWT